MSSTALTKSRRKNEERTCPHCNSSQIQREGDKLVCMNCGSVIEESVISSEQEQFYSYEDVIKKGKHSYTSNSQPKTRTERRNLQLAISYIDGIVNEFHLPHFVREDSIKRYKQLMQKKKIRKDTVPSIAAALVYLVCRKSLIPLPLKRLAEDSEASKSKVVKRYQEIIEKLRLDIPPPSVEGLAIRLAKKAELRPKTVALAKKIASKLKDDVNLIGKDPNGIAAAAVYTAAKKRKEEVTQEKIAKNASITSITLRNQLETISFTLQ